MERGEEEEEGEFEEIKESEHRGLEVRSRKMADFNLDRIIYICGNHHGYISGWLH